MRRERGAATQWRDMHNRMQAIAQLTDNEHFALAGADLQSVPYNNTNKQGTDYNLGVADLTEGKSAPTE